VSRRSRHSTSFKPHADHLEERAGASVLIPGELPIAAADHLKPAEDGPSQTRLNQPAPSETVAKANTSGSYSLPTEDLKSGISVVVGSDAAGASASEPADTHRAPVGALGTLATDGIIRPLALAPSAPPVSPGLGSILFPAGGVNPLMGSAGPSPQAAAAGGVASQGSSAAAGGAATEYAAAGGAPAAVQPGGSANAPAIGYIAPGPAPANVGTGGGGGAPTTGHAAAGSAPVAARPGRRAGAPMSRYVATGGGASATILPKVEFAVSGNAASSGTTISAGGSGVKTTAGSIAGSLYNAGTVSGGTYSIAGTSPSGGGTLNKGKVAVSPQGVNYIGGGANFVATVYSITGGSPTLSAEVWELTGPTPAYASGAQAPPNPSGTPPATAFVNTDLDTASFDGKQTMNLAWGEQPGVNDLFLTGTVTVDGKKGSIKPLNLAIAVHRPQLNYKIQYQTSTSLFTGKSSYAIEYGSDFPGKLAATGINWNFSTAPGIVGSLAVVQVLQSGTNYSYHTNWLGGTIYSTMGSGTGAKFPLLDNAANATTVFYNGNQGNPAQESDSPAMGDIPWGGNLLHGLWPATWAQMSLSATDYVMFNAGGMWVPLASFTWQVNAVASFGSPPTIDDIKPPKPTKPSLDSTWPTWTQCCGGNYTTYHVS
jgi:hypothetical protein